MYEKYIPSEKYTPSLRTLQGSLTSAVSTYVLAYEVPQNDTIQIHFGDFSRQGGDRTADIVYLWNQNRFIPIYYAAAAAYVWLNPYKPIPIPSGARIYLNFGAGGAADGTWAWRLYVLNSHKLSLPSSPPSPIAYL